jgi:hypothetical protein
MRKRAQRGDEKGAVLVEAILVLPILIILVLGIIEFGLAFASSSTTTASSRSGGRIAATAYPPSVGATAQRATADQIADAVTADLTALSNATPIGMTIYKVDPTSTSGAPVGGFPGANMSGGCSSNCFKYLWNAGSNKLVYSSGGWASPDACGATVDSIGVFVQVSHEYLADMFGSTRTVTGHTVMRLEPLPTDQCS